MAKIHEIPAELRKDEGKGASRRLRHADVVPAILYGGKEQPQSIQFVHKDVYMASQHEWFYSSIIDLKIDGKNQKALLRDMQRHPYKQRLLHLDFQRVSENEALKIRVPLHFLNQEKSPAGKTAGVLVTHELNEILVSCLPKDLPEYIEVDLGNLNIGDIVHLSDLKLPAGLEIPELKLGKEHDVAVVLAKVAKEEVEAAPVVDAAAAAPAAPAKGGKAPAKAAPAKAPAAAPAPAKKK
ncbi:MAG: 50S ribosomal protein L25/general stress protein Ctc [Lysobacterales bacterium 69-70]|nr:50S ribosomal protein L25/general stress protein Ctc [Xanthomonadaceae bacterium]ODU32388.1 MAG: 50S ribosomal protein L25/general stress protein Ctc [Xanthomonadaceae bacterium SCN 69-320]ODV15550.1 MAG: 50S ribosomal protein L25/general stress protein Ctc [Xanthomonadaceae bacterium SCN 69-25]OJY95493.1 MAG: 50S ribosomal protein L25/general stress protein Ctc [Xanthomonadales bacterium 69-70]